MTDDLRKLAAQLREENARRIQEKRVKCANIAKAALGLGLLSKKLRGPHGA